VRIQLRNRSWLRSRGSRYSRRQNPDGHKARPLGAPESLARGTFAKDSPGTWDTCLPPPAKEGMDTPSKEGPGPRGYRCTGKGSEEASGGRGTERQGEPETGRDGQDRSLMNPKYRRRRGMPGKDRETRWREGGNKGTNRMEETCRHVEVW